MIETIDKEKILQNFWIDEIRSEETSILPRSTNAVRIECLHLYFHDQSNNNEILTGNNYFYFPPAKR